MSRISNRGRRFLGIATCSAIAFSPNCASAQISPDGTLPNNSIVTPNGSTLNITGGTQAGGNLFHSFQQFSVPTGSEAHFSNALDIQNIFSRVTGKSVSNIDGLIKTKGTANLFLINPNGIIFGQNARLDIGGSFLASTASSLKFADGTEFNAKAPQATSLLTVSVPIGLQYGRNAGDIRVQGVGGFLGSDQGLGLIVPEAKTLALVGGNVTLEDAFLNAPGGRIELGSVAGVGQVNLNPTNQGWTLNYQGIQNFENIQLSRSFVDIAIKEDSSIQVPSEDSAISIRASQLDMGRSSIVRANNFTSAPGGDANIDVQRLTMREGAVVSTSAFGAGSGGDLTVNATESVELTGTISGGLFPSTLSTTTTGAGKAGSLTITTPVLLVRDGALVQTATFSSGDGGSLNVNASESVQLIGTTADGKVPSGLFASTEGTGKAGSVTITTPVLLVRGGAQALAATFSSGDGGSLNVNASESVQLIGTTADGKFPSGLFASNEGTGDAGDLSITTPTFIVSGGARVTVSSIGEGVAGNLGITANSVRLDNGKILAQTSSGNGGNLKLNVADLLLMRRSSEISTTAGTAQQGGDGGSITIDTPNGFIVAVPNENSDISANAFTGRGGKVQINAFGIYGTQFREKQNPQTSDITASSEFGVNGTVELNTPEIDPNSGLINLPSVPIDTKLAQGCNSPNYAQSSFIVTGRGGLPPNPRTDLLTPDAVEVDWVTLKPSNRNRSISSVGNKPTLTTPEPIVEATGWVRNEKGEIVFTANAPTITPHESWQKPASCQLPSNQS